MLEFPYKTVSRLPTVSFLKQTFILLLATVSNWRLKTLFTYFKEHKLLLNALNYLQIDLENIEGYFKITVDVPEFF